MRKFRLLQGCAACCASTDFSERSRTWQSIRTRSRRRDATCGVRTIASRRPAIAVEPTTGETHLRHHVSPTGFYRGKKVVSKTEAE